VREMLAQIIDEAKNAVVAVIKGADDVMSALRSAVRNQVGGAVKDAETLAIESAQTVGVDATDAATAAVSGAIRAAEKIGGQTASIVREALLGAATLPRDVVERVLKGSEE